MIRASINQLLRPVQYQTQGNREGASRKVAEAGRLEKQTLKIQIYRNLAVGKIDFLYFFLVNLLIPSAIDFFGDAAAG